MIRLHLISICHGGGEFHGNSLATGDLLETLDQESKSGSSEVLHSTVVEKLSKRKVSGRLGSRVDNTLPSLENAGVIDGDVVEVREHGNSLGMSASSNEPSRRLGHSEDPHARQPPEVSKGREYGLERCTHMMMVKTDWKAMGNRH